MPKFKISLALILTIFLSLTLTLSFTTKSVVLAQEDDESETQDSEQNETEINDQRVRPNTELRQKEMDLNQSYKEEREALRSQYKENKERLKMIRMEKAQEIQEMKSEYENKIAIRREQANEALDEVKLERIARIKENAIKTETRMHKVAEYLYARLERISAFADEQKEGGFDTGDYDKQIEAVEKQIATVEDKINTLSNYYENIETLNLIEIQANLKNMRATSKEIIDDFKKIRSAMVDILQGLR